MLLLLLVLSLVGKDDASQVDGDLLFASAVMSAEAVPKTNDDSNDSE